MNTPGEDGATVCDWSSPAMIIGLGRSGSTLLSFILGAHPDVYMAGETNFMLPRLWRTFRADPMFFRFVRLARLYHQRMAASEPFLDFHNRILDDMEADTSIPLVSLLERRDGERFAAMEAEDDARMARTLGAALGSMLIPPSLRRPRWGIKEIWAGWDGYAHDWTLYRLAFPGATYVHCLRHPLGFARSYFSLHKYHPSRDQLLGLLRNWVGVTTTCRRQKDAGRYLEIRYEDLVATPEPVVAAVYAAAGLPPDDSWRPMMAQRFSAVDFSPCMPTLAPDDMQSIDGLMPLLNELYPQDGEG